MVLAGTASAPFFRPVAEWLADKLGTEVVALPGGHTPHRDRPEVIAEAIKLFASSVIR